MMFFIYLFFFVHTEGNIEYKMGVCRDARWNKKKNRAAISVPCHYRGARHSIAHRLTVTSDRCGLWLFQTDPSCVSAVKRETNMAVEVS